MSRQRIAPPKYGQRWPEDVLVEVECIGESPYLGKVYAVHLDGQRIGTVRSFRYTRDRTFMIGGRRFRHPGKPNAAVGWEAEDAVGRQVTRRRDTRNRAVVALVLAAKDPR